MCDSDRVSISPLVAIDLQTHMYPHMLEEGDIPANKIWQITGALDHRRKCPGDAHLVLRKAK